MTTAESGCGVSPQAVVGASRSDTLMDITRFKALKITPKSIDGADHLFIEDSGFNSKNPVDWKGMIVVLKRGGK